VPVQEVDIAHVSISLSFGVESLFLLKLVLSDLEVKEVAVYKEVFIFIISKLTSESLEDRVIGELESLLN
jgi:hypothetical protein